MEASCNTNGDAGGPRRGRGWRAGMRTLSLAGLAAVALAGPAPAGAATFKTLYSFSGGADGAAPIGQLAMGKDGLLYGTTSLAGAGGAGTVYRLDPASGVLTTLYAFTGGADGFLPVAGVILDAKGMVYGTTEEGGAFACPDRQGCGTAWRLDPATLKLTTLVSFPGGTGGSQPTGALLLYGGLLYGSTQLGGYSDGQGDLGSGTLFSLDPKTRALTTLHEFGLPGVKDGIEPESSLTVGPDGRLYGSASLGGPNNAGTLYAIDPISDAFSVLHGFDYHVDGFGPDCRVIFLQGQIIGTTRAGGPTQAADGTVFSFDPNSGVLTTLYSIAGQQDGLFPLGGVVRGPKGLLYGVASQGGQSGAGTVFAVSPKTGKFTLLHDFDGADGSQPSGELLLDEKSILYGVTEAGGRGHGVVYEIIP
jgi:uncharacterized repeat protein (TIGR03803 family)